MPKVKIFSTKTCPYCHMLKEYLKSKNVSYEEVLLDEHPEQAVESMHVCNSMGVPCTHIVKDDGSEARILGFDKPKIDQALGLA
ncbi:NrdH-redoxin [Candidatus Saccharibacteria bacterium]|nr:NrdH-redoxin [Candidatus Saccharibacteria bacterium]